jgi:hypothetical protein
MWFVQANAEKYLSLRIGLGPHGVDERFQIARVLRVCKVLSARISREVESNGRSGYEIKREEIFHKRLTPELSRPVAGRRTRASVAQARGRRHDAGSA